MKNIAPILIVGAGPSGLMMAHEFMRYKIPFLIIDKAPSKSPYSRAIAVQIRTLEIFHSLGLLNRLQENSQAVRAIEIFAEGRPAIAIAVDEIGLFFDRFLFVDQPHTELVLEEALKQQGHEINRGVELVDFSQNLDGITAHLRGPNDSEKIIKFSYVIGADGAHSMVRKHMSNQFAGSAYEDAFILADAECVHQLNQHTVRVFFKKKHFLAMIPMHGKNHYRLIALRRGETNKEGPAPQIEEFQELAKILVPFPMEIKHSTWVSRFFVQCRSASHYREARAFLVGDAAHIHSPAGGQGMNTGLQDAFNLAWKLAFALKGLALDSLLDSYHDERKPVGDFLLDRTDRFFKFMVKSSLWARLLRRFILPHVGKSPRARKKLITIASQTAIRYEHGALCDKRHDVDFVSLKIGERILNLSLQGKAGARDLHEVITGLYFSWLIFVAKDTHDEEIKRIAKLFVNKNYCQCLIIEMENSPNQIPNEEHHFYLVKNKIFPVSKSWFAVVRPDQHIFCLGHIHHLDHSFLSVRKFLKII